MLRVGVRTAVSLLLIGIALIFWGVLLIFPPAAIIIAGVAVLAFVLFRVDIDLGGGGE
jgi:hypothetical protein